MVVNSGSDADRWRPWRDLNAHDLSLVEHPPIQPSYVKYAGHHRSWSRFGHRDDWIGDTTCRFKATPEWARISASVKGHKAGGWRIAYSVAPMCGLQRRAQFEAGAQAVCSPSRNGGQHVRLR